MKRILIICLLFICFKSAYSQDIHFSHITYSPIYTNPAFTGFFDGNLRLYTNYRSQYYNLTGISGIQTIYGSADMRINFGPWCKDYIGVGLVAFNDRLGANKLNTTNLTLSAAYSKAMGKKRNHVLNTGFSFSYFQRKIDGDVSGLQFGSQHNGLIFDPNLVSGEFVPDAIMRNMDLSVGVLYFANLSKKTDMYGGFSVAHILQPNFGPIETAGEILPRRYSAQIGMTQRFSKKLSMAPVLFLNHQNKVMDITTGALFRNVLYDAEGSETALIAGLYTRLYSTPVKAFDLESMIFLLGVEYSKVRFTFGYDANLNKLKSATRAQGAFEVSLRFITDMFKCKSQYSFCPQL